MSIMEQIVVTRETIGAIGEGWDSGDIDSLLGQACLALESLDQSLGDAGMNGELPRSMDAGTLVRIRGRLTQLCVLLELVAEVGSDLDGLLAGQTLTTQRKAEAEADAEVRAGEALEAKIRAMAGEPDC